MAFLRTPLMNPRALLQAAAGLILCAIGYFLCHREAYEVHTVLATAGGCQMATDIYEPRSGTPAGYVVLFHGLAANKKVMAFNAQEFANQDLRVFVPDLPGHGRTPGPFTPDRADSCALALVQDLAARKAILPARTLLVGHSMGGAIAARVGAAFPVAGVIALSPAPMKPQPGLVPEALLFPQPPLLPGNSLVLSAEWEPFSIKKIAAALVEDSKNSSNRFSVIPSTTHVSIMFSDATFKEIRIWTSQLLGTNADVPLPPNRPALACLLGLLGLSLVVPPFLREMNPAPKSTSVESAPSPDYRTGVLLLLLSALAVSFLLATHLIPIHFVRIFQGDYLGVFLFLTGFLGLALRRKLLPLLRSFVSSSVASTVASALILVLLFAAWFELTFYEAWLSPTKWLRLPVFFLLLLPWHLAEEIYLGDTPKSPNFARLWKALGIRAVVWFTLLFGILVLHSGEILLALLLVYFVLFSIAQRLACDLVRFRTQSSAATAVFGAILLAAFALAIFPVA